MDEKPAGQARPFTFLTKLFSFLIFRFGFWCVFMCITSHTSHIQNPGKGSLSIKYKMRPIKPALPGQNEWVSSELPSHSSCHRTSVPVRSPLQLRHEISADQSKELIDMTAPYITTSSGQSTSSPRDIRPCVQLRKKTPPPATASHPPKHRGMLEVRCAPVALKYSKDAHLFDRLVNDNNGDDGDDNMTTTSFSHRSRFNTIIHDLKKKEALELTRLNMNQCLQQNSRSEKIPPLDLTSHKYIGENPSLQFLHSSPRGHDMRVLDSTTTSMVQVPTRPITPLHPRSIKGGDRHSNYQTLHRTTSLCHDKNVTSKWQADYIQTSNRCVVFKFLFYSSGTRRCV